MEENNKIVEVEETKDNVDRIIKEDLGTVMDDIFNEKELRKGKGGISFLTHDVISRIDLTKDAFVMALTMFVNDDIWK